jgi:hypothetical protein
LLPKSAAIPSDKDTNRNAVNTQHALAIMPLPYGRSGRLADDGHTMSPYIASLCAGLEGHALFERELIRGRGRMLAATANGVRRDGVEKCSRITGRNPVPLPLWDG